MGVVAKGDEGNTPMADERESSPASEPQESLPAESLRHEGVPAHGGAAAPQSGFLHIYKPGQGYWTRLMTTITTVFLAILIFYFALTNLRIWAMPEKPTPTQNGILIGVMSVIAVAIGVTLWRVLNKPGVVDFLIVTETEMKKVNWTSRKDLIGSTKIVILFMFLISGALFFIDIVFGYLFYKIGVLLHGPFS